MTVAHLCDGPGCGARIDITKPGWFGLDERIDTDDDPDDMSDWVDSDDYGLHFCTPNCLAAWAMDRAVDNPRG